MGCYGCYYDDSILEEAKNNLKKLINLRKNKCGKIKYDTCICGTKDLEIVLNALDDSIPKKEIESRIKKLRKEKQKLQEKYNKNIDKWMKEGKKAANECKDKFNPYIPTSEEICIETKISHIVGSIIELEKISSEG